MFKKQRDKREERRTVLLVLCNRFAFVDLAAPHCSIFTSICMIINQITHQLPEPEEKKMSV